MKAREKDDMAAVACAPIEKECGYLHKDKKMKGGAIGMERGATRVAVVLLETRRRFGWSQSNC